MREQTGDPPPVDRYAVTPDASRAEFLAACKLYAREVAAHHGLDADVSGLSWEVSARAKRRAGAVFHRDGEPTRVNLTWEYFEERGWAAVAATVRHELIHVHLLNADGDAGHGDRFRELADQLDTHVHCERFADPNYWVVCGDCGRRGARYRKSRLVKNPGEYRCGECGGPLRVEEAEAD